MLNVIKSQAIVIFFLLLNFAFSQHYDIGYNTDYQYIKEIESNNITKKEILYIINDNKKIKKIFDEKDVLLEELVFVDNQLVSGIEYFTHFKFPFLKKPRSFKIEYIERTVSNYENIKFSSSLVKYMPKLKTATFKTRVYQHNTSEFYLLHINRKYELYFK
tara:strand:- start:1154 stop:1636 length:483 start_codon:yes stop_codon:yes gene_type:complete